MRLFAALTPPEDVLEDLEEFLAPRREAAGFRWTVPEQWHLTLAFFAAVPERRLDDLVERLGRAASRRTTMRVAVAGGGAFPHVGKAKVLWAGIKADVHDGEELRRLATGCRAAASHAGVETQGNTFRPHLTLARIGHPVEASSWVRLLDTYRGPSWAADEVALTASYLGEGPRRRPRYETIAQLPLAVG